MTSVVAHWPLMHVFDRLGRLSFLFHLLGFLPGIVLLCTDGHFLSDYVLGWLAAADSFIVLFCG